MPQDRDRLIAEVSPAGGAHLGWQARQLLSEMWEGGVAQALGVDWIEGHHPSPRT